jgi:hypothetical protein
MTKSSGSDPRNTLYCSFCGKSQHEVTNLIAGPTVFICNECVHVCMGIVRAKEVVIADSRSTAEDEGLENKAASFHFSEALIVPLNSDADFLAVERQMSDLLRQRDALRDDDRLLDLYWGLYSIVAKTKPKGLPAAAVKLRLLLDPELGMEIGERAEDYISLRQILATVEHEISLLQPAAAPDTVAGGGSSANTIGFGDQEPR